MFLVGIAAQPAVEEKNIEKQSITEFNQLLNSKKIKNVKQVDIYEESNTVQYKLKEKTYQVRYPSGLYISFNPYMIEKLTDNNIPIEFKKSFASQIRWVGTLFYYAILVFFVYFIIRSLGMFQGSKVVRVEDEKTKFKDIAGYLYVKEEMKEIVEFLNEPEKFKKYTEDIPKGIMLSGPPGNGKTMFARAIAGETSTPFFHISASTIEDKYVGSGSRNVERIFEAVREEANKSGKAILFIDEIDAVGMARERRTVVETSQTLNAILTAMDGFDKNTNIIVIAATNLVETLDSALTRAGRFDRKIVIPKPNLKDRKAIINLYLHAKGDLIHPHVYEENYSDVLAQQTEGFCNADLHKLVNEASLLAKKFNKEQIDIECLRESFIKIIVGLETDDDVSEEDLKIVAYHEAGHAVAQILTHKQGHKGIAYITVTPRGESLGHVAPLSGGRLLSQRSDLENEVKVILAGRAVEEKILSGDFTTGAYGDLQQANRVLFNYVTKYGMGKNLENFFMENVDETSELVQTEIQQIREELYQSTKEMIEKHYDMVEAIATYLLSHSYIDQYQLEEILKDTTYTER